MIYILNNLPHYIILIACGTNTNKKYNVHISFFKLFSHLLHYTSIISEYTYRLITYLIYINVYKLYTITLYYLYNISCLLVYRSVIKYCISKLIFYSLYYYYGT